MDRYVEQLQDVLAGMEEERAQLDRDIIALRAMIARKVGTARGRKSSSQTAILDAMESDRVYAPSEVANALGMSANAVSAAMGRMAKGGTLVNEGRGRYLKPAAPEPLRPDPVEAFTGVAASDDDIPF